MPLYKCFPNLIYSHTSIEQKNIRKHLLKEIEAWKNLDIAGQKWSQKNYPHGYTSYGSIADLHQRSSSFADLQKVILKHAKKYSKHLSWDTKNRQLCLTHLWINIMEKGCIHTGHIHPMSHISGTFYVSTHKDSPEIKFEDSRLLGRMGSPPLKNQAQNFFRIKPKDAELILFESWQRHEVDMHRGEKKRISVSFNLIWD